MSILRAIPLVLLPLAGAPAAAQQAPPTHALDSLVALALSSSPVVHAAEARVRAAAAAVPQAGARPDPMLMAGVANLPLGGEGFDEPMAMKMVGLSQTFPFPGKLRLRTAAAARELEAAEAHLTGRRLEVTRGVRTAWYDLVESERLLDVVTRNQRVLVGLAEATQASYRVGRSGQEDILHAQVEAAGLAEEAAALSERRQAAVARIEALVSAPLGTLLEAADFPPRVRRAATPPDSQVVRFASALPGARAAGSPIPSVDSLQQLAAERNAMLRMHGARVAAQAARADLARIAARPDLDVSLSYGQRDGRADMLSASIALPLPLQGNRRYGQGAVEAAAELAALESEHHAGIDRLHAEVARLVGDLERSRTQLALQTAAIIPQADAALQAATAGFQVGRTGFETLVSRQAAVFNAEVAYVRALADFARSLAALEEVVGTEILP